MGITRRRFITLLAGASGGAVVGAATTKEGEDVVENMKHGAVAGGVVVVGAHEMMSTNHGKIADNGPDKNWRIRERERHRDEQKRRDELDR